MVFYLTRLKIISKLQTNCQHFQMPLGKTPGNKNSRMLNACKTSSCTFPLALQKTIMASQKDCHFSHCYTFWRRDDANKPVHLRDRLSACGAQAQWALFHCTTQLLQAGAVSATWSEGVGGCEQVAAPAASSTGCPWPPASCSALLHSMLEP